MDDLPDDWLCDLMNTVEPPLDEFDSSFSSGMISVSSMESMEQCRDVQREMGLHYSSSTGNISGLEVSENARTTAYRATATRPPMQAQNHVLAERKRRERLNQMLIALSALIPGLKKMDKASVIGDATAYIKLLKERVQKLEEEIKKRARGPISTNETSDSSDEYSAWSHDQLQEKKNSNLLFPEIVVRYSEYNVLVRIHCQKKEGIATRVVRELEKLHFEIISSSAMPFGSTALEITIITQKGDRQYITKAKELVETLRAAILKIV